MLKAASNSKPMPFPKDIFITASAMPPKVGVVGGQGFFGKTEDCGRR
jgi:hypothetical protein